MGLARFLVDLEETGAVRVPLVPDAPGPLDPGEQAAVEAALVALDRRLRPDLPGRPPALDLPAAAWAARMLWRAAGHLALRATEPALIARGLSEPCPTPPGPAATHAVDLTLSLLPDLVRLARGVPERDPLRVGLRALCQAWPLSSVGVPDLGPVDVTPFVLDAALLARYVDRILERGDASRLGPARVREAARAALGLHAELAPEIARVLEGS